ncbi:MAG: single-stranded-DNA-specific exonuclease RecJ, partial [Xanthomonadales bacterium]|nr:single-stranded-DNA-specific exonuclease RecJ [Xanthomonadales bacterium]NIX12148.1 single-stranded-DNA-specific exonuclease RecJ [Xanthomonadales bacterium]
MIARPRIRTRRLPESADSLPSSLHPVVRRVLLARGVTAPDHLELGLGGLLGPASLSGLQSAARMLADAVRDDREIMVVGDFDADGATGTA